MIFNRNFKIEIGLMIFSALFFYSCGSASQQTTTKKNYSKAVLAMNQGVKWYNKGCYQTAVKFFWDANEQFSAVDLPEGVAISLNGIGNANHHLGEIDEAILILNQSLIIYEQLNQPQKQIKNLSDIAATYLTVKDLERAEEWIDKGEKLSEKWELDEVALVLTKGVWLTHKKEYDQARKVLLSAFDLAESDDLTTMGTIHAALGHIELKAGNSDTAQEHFVLALDADRQIGFHRGIADNLAELGQIFIQKKQIRKGLFYLQRSVKVYALLGDHTRVDQLLAQINPLADSVGQDIRLTQTLAHRWLKGEIGHQLCRQ
jgi:tetratricopeptide (TPR) repeat protein